MSRRFSFALSLALCCVAGGASATDLEPAASPARPQGRSGVWAGAALTTGLLRMEAPTAQVNTRLSAQPAFAAGVDYWPEASIGLTLEGTLGAGTHLDLPATGGTLAYAVSHVAGGARYRWPLSAGVMAPALFAGLGLRLVRQRVQIQRPALLLNRTIAGPELSAGGEIPLFGDRLWLRASARAGVPFFVRESPADSGDPQSFWSFGGRAEAVVAVWQRWRAQLAVDYHEQRLAFAGEGTRAAGIEEGRTRDRFTTWSLGARYEF